MRQDISPTKSYFIAGHIQKIRQLLTSSHHNSDQLIDKSLWWIAFYSGLIGDELYNTPQYDRILNNCQRRKIWQFIRQFSLNPKGQEALQQYASY